VGEKNSTCTIIVGVPIYLTCGLVDRVDPAGDAAALVPPSPASGSEETPVKVTRSIMIKRPAGYPSSPRSAASTPPASPLGTTPPISPFAGAGEFPAPSIFPGYGYGQLCHFRTAHPCLVGSVVTHVRVASGFVGRKLLDGAYWGRAFWTFLPSGSGSF
jgi:hypothetical protein